MSVKVPFRNVTVRGSTNLRSSRNRVNPVKKLLCLLRQFNRVHPRLCPAKQERHLGSKLLLMVPLSCVGSCGCSLDLIESLVEETVVRKRS